MTEIKRSVRKGVQWSDNAVAEIKGMAARGDRQMDIAVYTGRNQGRVNEVIKDRAGRWKHVVPVAPELLPKPGPYRVVSVAAHDEEQIKARACDWIVAELGRLMAHFQLVAGNNGTVTGTQNTLSTPYT